MSVTLHVITIKCQTRKVSDFYPIFSYVVPIILNGNAGDSVLFHAIGVKFADQVKKRAGEAFDDTASGPVASVEVVSGVWEFR